MRYPVRPSLLRLLLLFTYCTFAFLGCAPPFPATPSHAQASSQRMQALNANACARIPTFPAGQSFNQTLRSDSRQRTYRVHIPMAYKTGTRYPLVLSFHGHRSNALEQEQRTGFSQLADQQGFLVVYPQGLVGPDHFTGWATGPRQDPQVDDVRFVSDLLTTLQTTFCIDPSRIYVSGFSNGGAMTNLLACDLANRFAAFAPVSGSYTPVKNGCHPQRPVPILEIHGTADTVVPYSGNPAKAYPPISIWLQSWARLNGCQHGPQVFFTRKNVLGEQWTGCQEAGALLHYRISQGQHTWPLETHQGGLDATRVIWNFFQEHSLMVNSPKPGQAQQILSYAL